MAKERLVVTVRDSMDDDDLSLAVSAGWRLVTATPIVVRGDRLVWCSVLFVREHSLLRFHPSRALTDAERERMSGWGLLL